MLSEIDTRAHFGDAHIQATDWTDFHADFWTMNGRAYPDTLEPNGVRDGEGQLYAQTWDGTFDGDGNADLTTIDDIDADESRLFSNPLSSLVQCAPGRAGADPLRQPRLPRSHDRLPRPRGRRARS